MVTRGKTVWFFQQIQTNIVRYHQNPTKPGSVCTLLTVHIHQDADIGASHGVEHLTGDGLGEEGVVCCGDKHTLPGPLQQHATFSPSDGEDTHHNLLSITNHCYGSLSAGDIKQTNFRW